MGSACSQTKGVNDTQAEKVNTKAGAGASEQKYTANTNGALVAPAGATPNGSTSNSPAAPKASIAEAVPKLDITAHDLTHPTVVKAQAQADLTANDGSYKLIMSSWAQAMKRKDFAISVYHKLLFKYQAATEALFFGVDIALQSQRLVDMIDSGIKLLDQPDALIPVMLQLGSRHVLYGVSDAHFDMFNDVLAEAMKDAIGYWNAELTTQWVRILTLFKTMIVHGYTTPAGLQMRKRYNQRVQRNLNKCWTTVVENDKDNDECFVAVLHRFGRQKVGGRAEMFNGIVARRVPFMALMNLAFLKGPEDPEVMQQLHESGARHIAYGVEERDYDAYAGPFIAAIQQKASPDTFNPFVKAQLTLFWVAITKLLIQGAAESKSGFTLRFAPKTPGFALVMANIEKSTQLWEGQQEGMLTAVQSHYRMLRELIQAHDAYEVGVDKDSFTLACKDIHQAIALTMRLQVFLLRNPTEGFDMDAETEGQGPMEVWNNHTLRLRVGLHWCKDVQVNFNVQEKKYEYEGPDVEICKYITDMACGGQTVVTEPTLRHFLNIAKLGDETEAMGDLMSINGSLSPNLTNNNGTHIIGERAKFGDVFQHKVYMDRISIPTAITGTAYLSGGYHPSNTSLISIFPQCLAARDFVGRKRIPAPGQ